MGTLLTGQKSLYFRESKIESLDCNKSWLSALLILSGDLELNPGPGNCKYPCGVCSRPVKKNQKAVQCDSCDTWIHKKCMLMNTQIYEALANTSISWHCCSCGLPNFASSLFDSTASLNMSNSFEILNEYHDDNNQTVPPKFWPTHHSTPSKRSPKITNPAESTLHPRQKLVI